MRGGEGGGGEGGKEGEGEKGRERGRKRGREGEREEGREREREIVHAVCDLSSLIVLYTLIFFLKSTKPIHSLDLYLVVFLETETETETELLKFKGVQTSDV